MQLLDNFKYFLTRCGARMSQGAVTNLNASVSYLEVGRWFQAKGFDTSQRVDCRERLFDRVGERIRDKRVLYLEFGVFEGDATRYWSKLLKNRDSRLHGFDSFEGLPEFWLPQRPEGHFDLGGAIPQVDDDRVKFFKGWFEDTLPSYTRPPHDVLVLNLDADLYSSTNYVLNALKDAIVPGTYIYFDEFNQQFHELRAFDEFINQTSMVFSLVGVTRTLQHAVFQRTS
jgi:hypothetical protein